MPCRGVCCPALCRSCVVVHGAWQGSVVTCIAPAQPSWDGASNFTVRVDVLLYTPYTPGSASGRGVGPPADDIDDASVVSTLPVTAVMAVGLVHNSTASAARGSWRNIVYGSRLMYTYMASGSGIVCGCDLDPSTVCDACGKHVLHCTAYRTVLYYIATLRTPIYRCTSWRCVPCPATSWPPLLPSASPL
jgi:hypothetical protein